MDIVINILLGLIVFFSIGTLISFAVHRGWILKDDEPPPDATQLKIARLSHMRAVLDVRIRELEELRNSAR